MLLFDLPCIYRKSFHIYLSIYLSIYLISSIYIFVHISVRVYIYIYREREIDIYGGYNVKWVKINLTRNKSNSVNLAFCINICNATEYISSGTISIRDKQINVYFQTYNQDFLSYKIIVVTWIKFALSGYRNCMELLTEVRKIKKNHWQGKFKSTEKQKTFSKHENECGNA